MGEPVIIVQNDYTRGIFNGDQGLILKCQWADVSGLGFVMRTQSGFRALPLRQVQSIIQHAYSITVHKSQGSEFERVAIMLSGEASPLLTRELIYTAVTRARTAVVLAGPEHVLQGAVTNPVNRNTGLLEWITEGSSPLI